MVDSAVVARGGLVKQRNLGKPRPLRSDPDLVNLGEVLRLVEEVETGLSVSRNNLDTRKKTQQLKELLRLNGVTLETLHPDLLDKLEVSMRDACKDMRMDIVTRLNLLEMIELRLNNWSSSPQMLDMYRQKLSEAQLDIDMKKIGYQGGDRAEVGYQGGDRTEEDLTRSGPIIMSGVSSNPVKAGSGDSVSSLLQEKNPPESELGFSSRLEVNGQTVLIRSTSEHLTRTSKDVLLEFFSVLEEDSESKTVSKTDLLSYEKEELLRLSKSPLCRYVPKDWEDILNRNPNILKKEGAPTKHFLRELEMIKKQEAARRM
jgi:hypothetical protein